MNSRFSSFFSAARVGFVAVAVAVSTTLSGCGGGDDSPTDTSLIKSAQAQSVSAKVVERDHLFAILRPDANGNWYIQTDEGPNPDPDHAAHGISWKVEQTDQFVRIFFLRNYTHAGQITITSDDDFAGKVQGNSNLGLNHATIFISVKGERINPGRILEYVPTAGQAGNFWISVDMTNKK